MSKKAPISRIRIIPSQIINNMYNYHYYKKPCCNNKTRGMSFLAFVFCGFSYGCIFYVFSVSPCDVMRDVRFLFFFSNTLILIIAADYSSFMSSSEADLEESWGEFASEGPVASYAETDNNTKELLLVGEDLPKDEETVEEDDPPVQERSEELKLLTYNDIGIHDVKDDTDKDEDGERWSRLAGEKEQVVAGKEEESDEFSWTSDETDTDRDGEGSTTADEEERVVGEGEENDEFLRMSDEELNKRVEEFIRMLKTQIRLQATRDTE